MNGKVFYVLVSSARDERLQYVTENNNNKYNNNNNKFCICSSVHHNSRLKKSNKVQHYADIYLLLN